METTKPTLAAAQPDAARATLFRNVYLWMTMALALTALTAYTVAGSETLLQAIFSSRFVFLGLIVAELVLVFVLAANIMRMSFLTATLMFIAYSVVNGATLSTIFLVYDLGSIGLTFLVTAGMFGAMSLYGFVTGRDLSSWGNLLTMALVGVILASVVNLFLRSEMLMWIVTYVGILLFVGLTAYDTQTIKRMIYSGAEVDEPMQKMALLGALSLYLDFINLFLYMLRLLGKYGVKKSLIVFVFSLFSLLTAAPFLIFEYHPMTMQQIAMLLLAGVSAALGQFSVTNAYAFAPAREISVFDYSQVVFSAILGFFLFQQIPDLYSLLGYLIVCGSAVGMFLRSNRKDAQTV